MASFMTLIVITFGVININGASIFVVGDTVAGIDR
jgi:hypothetical protein